MPLPLVVVGVDIPEPTIRSENVGLPIAVHICDANAMPVPLFLSNMMNLRFSAREIDPQNSRVIVVSQDEIRFAITVDVAGRSALCVIAVCDEVALPHHSRYFRILIPPQPVLHPSRRHNIGSAIMVYVERPFSAI